MERNIAQLFEAMLEVNKGDQKRIEHAVKVFQYALQIGMLEDLSEQELGILEASAILHDIGIQISLKKYNSSAARYQEQEGPAIARELLETLSFETNFIERVCYLVGNHHTYTKIDDQVFQILVEADFLVNAVEDCLKSSQIDAFSSRYFKTNTGKRFLACLAKEG